MTYFEKCLHQCYCQNVCLFYLRIHDYIFDEYIHFSYRRRDTLILTIRYIYWSDCAHHCKTHLYFSFYTVWNLIPQIICCCVGFRQKVWIGEGSVLRLHNLLKNIILRIWAQDNPLIIIFYTHWPKK